MIISIQNDVGITLVHEPKIEDDVVYISEDDMRKYFDSEMYTEEENGTVGGKEKVSAQKTNVFSRYSFYKIPYPSMKSKPQKRPLGFHSGRRHASVISWLMFSDRSARNHWAVLKVTVTVTSQFGMMK